MTIEKTNATQVNLRPDIMSYGSDDGSFRAMTGEGIIAFVENMLSNVNGQLGDYQKAAEAKNKLANQWRAYKELAREYSGKSGEDFPTTEPAFSQEKARIEGQLKQFEDCVDPQLRAAAQQLRDGIVPRGPLPVRPAPKEPKYTGEEAKDAPLRAQYYADVEVHKREVEASRPKGFSKEAADDGLKNADDALQSLNQENELTMMRLSQLVQQRQHTVTFGTNQLESLNQCISNVLQNMK